MPIDSQKPAMQTAPLFYKMTLRLVDDRQNTVEKIEDDTAVSNDMKPCNLFSPCAK